MPMIDCSQKEDRSGRTDYKIAKAAGTSEDTVRKVRAINEKATDQTKQLVREGKLSINQAKQKDRECGGANTALMLGSKES